jgi:hypothetical protein
MRLESPIDLRVRFLTGLLVQSRMESYYDLIHLPSLVMRRLHLYLPHHCPGFKRERWILAAARRCIRTA